MNNIQNYGMISYQTTFNGKNKTVKTLADKLNQKKAINNKIANLSEKYFCSSAVIKKAFAIDNKTTINELNTRAFNFGRNMEQFKQILKRGLEKGSVKVGNKDVQFNIEKINICLRA